MTIDILIIENWHVNSVRREIDVKIKNQVLLPRPFSHPSILDLHFGPSLRTFTQKNVSIVWNLALCIAYQFQLMKILFPSRHRKKNFEPQNHLFSDTSLHHEIGSCKNLLQTLKSYCLLLPPGFSSSLSDAVLRGKGSTDMKSLVRRYQKRSYCQESDLKI